MRYARVTDGIVAEIINLPDEFNVTEAFHPDLASQIFPCPTDVQLGWTYDDKKFSAPATPAMTVDDLITYAAMKRFAIETDGIIVNGSTIATDRGSQSLITGAYSYVQANPSATVHFKTGNGFVEMTAEQLTTIANAVGAHVQACFGSEAEVDQQITAGTITTIAQINAFDWPSNA